MIPRFLVLELFNALPNAFKYLQINKCKLGISACRKLIEPTYYKPFFTGNDVNMVLSQERRKDGLAMFLLKLHIQRDSKS